MVEILTDDKVSMQQLFSYVYENVCVYISKTVFIIILCRYRLHRNVKITDREGFKPWWEQTVK